MLSNNNKSENVSATTKKMHQKKMHEQKKSENPNFSGDEDQQKIDQSRNRGAKVKEERKKTTYF